MSLLSLVTHQSEEVESAGGLLGVGERLDNVLSLVELLGLDSCKGSSMEWGRNVGQPNGELAKGLVDNLSSH